MSASGNAVIEPALALGENLRLIADLHQSAFGKLLLQRRAVKYFSPEIPVSDEIIEQIVSVASLAPSAFNLQHWKVFQIKNADLRQRIAELAYHQPQLYHAPVVLAVVMDAGAWDSRLQCEHNFNDPEKSGQDFLRLQALYQNKRQLARDEALRSSAMFSMLVMLAAEAAGFNSCPLTGCDFSAISEVLALPETQELCMLITIGKAAAENRTRSRKRLEPQHFFTCL
jgi:nitroreductase